VTRNDTRRDRQKPIPADEGGEPFPKQRSRRCRRSGLASRGWTASKSCATGETVTVSGTKTDRDIKGHVKTPAFGRRA